MTTKLSFTLTILLPALLTLLQFSLSHASPTNVDYIKHACSTTLYPTLCYNSLSAYATNIKTSPKALAATALNLTLSATASTARALRRMSKTHMGFRPREAAAMADCVHVVRDAVGEVRNSLREMMYPPRDKEFELRMSDIQTWVSAALTDEDTCMDGFSGHAVNRMLKDAVRRRIVRVAHLTSNALALVNNYVSNERSSTPP